MPRCILCIAIHNIKACGGGRLKRLWRRVYCLFGPPPLWMIWGKPLSDAALFRVAYRRGWDLITSGTVHTERQYGGWVLTFCLLCDLLRSPPPHRSHRFLVTMVSVFHSTWCCGWSKAATGWSLLDQCNTRNLSLHQQRVPIRKGGGCPSYQIIWQCTYASHNRQCGNREGAVLWTERMCPPEFVCWRLTSNRTVFEGGCFGSVLVKRVRGLVFGTSTIIGGTDAMIPPQGGHEENLKMLTREMDLPRHQGSQYSNLWGPRKVRNQCLLSSLHSCCILFSTPPNYMARGGYFQAWKICQSQDDVCQLQVYVCQSQDDVCQSQDDISSSLRKKNFRKGGHEGSQALPWKPIKDASEGSCL